MEKSKNINQCTNDNNERLIQDIAGFTKQFLFEKYVSNTTSLGLGSGAKIFIDNSNKFKIIRSDYIKNETRFHQEQRDLATKIADNRDYNAIKADMAGDLDRKNHLNRNSKLIRDHANKIFKSPEKNFSRSKCTYS